MLNRIDKWCSESELKLNLDKTEILNLINYKNKNNTKIEIRFNEKPLKIVDQIKYLGIVLDRKLLWNKHIEYLKTKTNLLLERVRKFLWLGKEIEMYRKLKIYFSVFLPMIQYGSEIWYPDIKHKLTYIKELEKIQNKIIVAITGMYRSSNIEKMLELLNVCYIEEELMIKDQCKDIERSERKMYKSKAREEFRARKKSFLFELDISNVKAKELFYIVTGKGPFRAFLNLIKKHDFYWCRYCGYVPETAIHLLIECHSLEIERGQTDFRNIENFERFCKIIIKKLYRDSHI